MMQNADEVEVFKPAIYIISNKMVAMLRMMTKKITVITKMGTYPELVKCSKAVFERTQDDDV